MTQAPPRSGRILAIDPGERRIGLALSDPTGTIASPYRLLEVRGRAHAVAEIAAIVRDESVTRIVIGLPIGLSGNVGPSALKAQRLAAGLRAATALEVVEWDERLSSAGAERALREGGLDSRAQRGKVDPLAATLILQGYLEARRGGEG